VSNILLVEPDYRSKFPPLGLMRIATFHKERGDTVSFARGMIQSLRELQWHRIYISSLFTYELPRTVRTIKYYLPAVTSRSDIVVGGIGATLMPEYIRERVPCRVVAGPLDKRNALGPGTPAIANLVPDYNIIESVSWPYKPEDSYFCRTTKGCVRKCRFCAVPRLEPVFGKAVALRRQIRQVRERFGERQHLVLLDNNVLAFDGVDRLITDIRREGFEAGARRNNRKRVVDFNQGIDARLISRKVANALATICLSPVRLAFDYDGMEKPYRRAIQNMVKAGFTRFTNYVMFNYNDTPLSLYRRLKINLEVSDELGVRVTGFPMRYVPSNQVNRRYVSQGWCWRYLRGIQCVLHATHGLVSPNPPFFAAAFGESYEEFLEIISMPDRYIIHRNRFRTNEARKWRRQFRKLSGSEREELFSILASLNRSRTKKADMARHKRFSSLLQHYYPGGEVPDH